MKAKRELDIAVLRSLIDYNPETGEFTWKARGLPCWDAKFAGNRAGHNNRNTGYVHLKLMGRSFKAHRVAFAITHGRWPTNEIDHIDGNGLNNSIANMREATRAENNQNRSRPSSNTSGYVGVGRTLDNMWVAQIRHNGVQHYIGYFDCPKKASEAYQEAKARLHTFSPVPRQNKKPRSGLLLAG